MFCCTTALVARGKDFARRLLVDLCVCADVKLLGCEDSDDRKTGFVFAFRLFATTGGLTPFDVRMR